MHPALRTLLPGPLAGESPAPIDAALAAGAAAAGVGGAFLGGYRAALQALVPSLPADGLTALCATEDGGAHPRTIATRLDPAAGGGWRMTGRKRWVTGGTQARRLLIVASLGLGPNGLNQLRVVCLPADTPGITLEAQPPTPFAPEVPHAAVELDRVYVPEAAMLEGDGWEGYLKPFRTVEDVHVHGALLAWLLALGLSAGWETPLLEEAAALLLATRELALRDPSAAATHVCLAGLLALSRAWIERTRAAWDKLPPATRAALDRDLALLGVAETARSRRAETAWRALSRDA